MRASGRSPDGSAADSGALGLRRAAERAGAGDLPALLLLAERLAATAQSGLHGRRRPGPGEEFWQYRPARPGDPLRLIDWRRSGRSDMPYVQDREWQLPGTLYLWVDPGAGMHYSSAPERRPEKALRARVLALALAVLALRGGEKVGLLAAGAEPARPGVGQAMPLARALCAEGAGGPEAGALGGSGNAAPGTAAVFFSDFMADPAPVGAALSALAAKGVRGALLQILDPAEEEFPFAGRTVFEAMSGPLRHETREAADLRERYRARLAERRDRLSRAAERAGWQFGTHRTDAPAQGALLWLSAALERGRR